MKKKSWKKFNYIFSLELISLEICKWKSGFMNVRKQQKWLGFSLNVSVYGFLWRRDRKLVFRLIGRKTARRNNGMKLEKCQRQQDFFNSCSSFEPLIQNYIEIINKKSEN